MKNIFFNLQIGTNRSLRLLFASSLAPLAFSAVLALNFMGCAYDSSPNDKISEQNKKYAEDREAFLKIYSPLVGTYDGTMTLDSSIANTPRSRGAGNSSIQSRLVLFLQEAQSGQTNASTDASGQPVLLPVLRGSFVRNDMIEREFILVTRYDEKTGNFLMTNPNAKTVEDVESISGSLLNNSFSGVVRFFNGATGQLNLKRTSGDTSLRSSSIDVSQMVLNEYKKIEGIYEGTVTPDENNQALPAGIPRQKPFRARITLRAVMTAQGKPLFKGYYVRLDDPMLIVSQELFVDFRRETYPEKVFMTSAGQGPNPYFFNLEADYYRPLFDSNNRLIKEARIEGQILMLRNFFGKIKLIRVKKF